MKFPISRCNGCAAGEGKRRFVTHLSLLCSSAHRPPFPPPKHTLSRLIHKHATSSFCVVFFVCFFFSLFLQIASLRAVMLRHSNSTTARLPSLCCREPSFGSHTFLSGCPTLHVQKPPRLLILLFGRDAMQLHPRVLPFPGVCPWASPHALCTHV